MFWNQVPQEFNIADCAGAVHIKTKFAADLNLMIRIAVKGALAFMPSVYRARIQDKVFFTRRTEYAGKRSAVLTLATIRPDEQGARNLQVLKQRLFRITLFKVV